MTFIFYNKYNKPTNIHPRTLGRTYSTLLSYEYSYLWRPRTRSLRIHKYVLRTVGCVTRVTYHWRYSPRASRLRHSSPSHQAVRTNYVTTTKRVNLS